MHKYQSETKMIAMKALRYKILLRKESDGTYTVIVPSLPGCLTYGRTVEEAIEMANEAIEGFIECLAARGEEIPIEEEPLDFSRSHFRGNSSR
jgi:antitoxin HicB